MGSASDIELLLKAHDAVSKKGSVGRTVLVGLATFIASMAGSAFAAGRYFEHASALVAEHERRIVELEKHREQDRNHLDETWTVAIDGKKVAEMQCHRIDAKWGERICP